MAVSSKCPLACLPQAVTDYQSPRLTTGMRYIVFSHWGRFGYAQGYQDAACKYYFPWI